MSISRPKLMSVRRFKGCVAQVFKGTLVVRKEEGEPPHFVVEVPQGQDDDEPPCTIHVFRGPDGWAYRCESPRLELTCSTLKGVYMPSALEAMRQAAQVMVLKQYRIRQRVDSRIVPQRCSGKWFG